VQSKDIPDLPILAFLDKHGGIGCNWYGIDLALEGRPDTNWISVRHAMPPETPHALVHAKMRRLMHRGLVDGCDCGCRGDFELTDKGRAFLAANLVAK
jgi:hypothetical protein